MHIRWRGMELPSALEVDRESLTETYGKFSAEPFERGFGASVGNSLRRVQQKPPRRSFRQSRSSGPHPPGPPD